MSRSATAAAERADDRAASSGQHALFSVEQGQPSRAESIARARDALERAGAKSIVDW